MYNKDSRCQACDSHVRAKNICFHYFAESSSIDSYYSMWHNRTCAKQLPNKISTSEYFAGTLTLYSYRGGSLLIPTTITEGEHLLTDLHFLSYWFLQRLPRGNTSFRTFATINGDAMFRVFCFRCFAGFLHMDSYAWYDTGELQQYLLIQLMARRVIFF